MLSTLEVGTDYRLIVQFARIGQLQDRFALGCDFMPKRGGSRWSRNGGHARENIFLAFQIERQIQ